MASPSAFSSGTRPPTLALTRTLTNMSAVLISSGSEGSPSPIYTTSRKENRPDSRLSKLMSSPSFVRRAREQLTYSLRRRSYDNHNTCEVKYSKLKAKFSELADRYRAKCDEHADLLRAVGNHLGTKSTNTSGSSTSAIATTAHISEPDIPERYAGLNRNNATTRFPDVKFWTRESFEKSQEKKPASRRKAADIMEVTSMAPSGSTSNNKGDPIPFAEYDNGSIMDEAASAAVRALLRQIFNGMGDRLPQRWGDISLNDSQYVYSQLYAHYPCFHLCHDNWKANYLVSRGLTSFHSSHKKKERKLQTARQGIKVEPKVEGADPADPQSSEGLIDSGKKRKAASGGDDNVAPPSKRLYPQPPSGKPPSSSPPPQPVSRPLLPPPLTLVPPPPPLPVPAPPLSEPSLTLPAPTPALPSTVPSPTIFLAPLSGAQPPLPTSPEVFVTPLQPEPAASSPLPPSSDPTTTASINQDHTHSTLLCNNDIQDTAPTASPHNGNNTTATSSSPNESTPMSPSANSPVGDPKKIAVANPLTSRFGAPKAPTKRLEALQKTRQAQQMREKDGDGSKGKNAEMLDSPERVSGSASTSTGFKKVTKSVAAKNLCYMAYLETNDPVTPAAFDIYWKGLPKDDVKRWNDLSKSRKAASAAEDNEGEEN